MAEPTRWGPDWPHEALLASWPDLARERTDDIRVVRAPGRVNLIGEYTDINAGYVMPAAIDLETRIAFVPTDDARVEITRLDTRETAGFALDRPIERQGSWIDYVAGTAWALAERGEPLTGLRGVLDSSVPIGAGLSSSAALEVASAWALSGPDGPRLAGMELAQTAQRGENAFVGVASGLMDQFASVFGVADAAILLDCRSLEYRTVRLPLAEHRLVVVHSGAPRRLEASAYNDRRADCQRALAVARRIQPRVETLRDVDAAMLERARPSMDETAHRRARHVISENDRVLATVAAFAEGDLDGVGRQWAASHVSLRDDFEVSIPALDALVEIATATEGVIAARMTGAGFGGCTVNLLRRDALERFEAAVERDYEGRTGLRARVIRVEAAPGAGRLA